MINYGLFSDLPSNTPEVNKPSPYLSVRVLDIILASDHPDWEKYGGWDALGLIKFAPFYSTIDDAFNSVSIARPLFSNTKSYPLIQELTYVINLPDPQSADNPNYSSYYYVNNVNIWNHPHHNAFPNIDYSKLPENLKLNYKEVETGLVRQQASESKQLFFGNTFVENARIKPLLPFEGDIIHEGRWGQSIRFGSTVKDKNSWSTQGNNGDPIIIIRNGQVLTSDRKGWIPTLEDINGDDSSIYMSSGQVIPINVASPNLESFSTIIQSVQSPIIKIEDNPLLPIFSSSNEVDQKAAVDKEENIYPTISTTSSISTTTSSIATSSIKEVYTEEDILFSFPGEETSFGGFQVREDEQELPEVESTNEKYDKNILMNESDKSKNTKGEYALYQNGNLIGYSPITFINQVRVSTQYEPFVKIMIEAAKKDGVDIKINSGLRTWDEQLALRKRYIKDKSKLNDEKFLLEAASTDFTPSCGRPGYSNHQNGRAFDFNTAVPTVYKWMVTNGIKYNFVRTVASERWHWEYLPNTKQFAYVPKTHPTWDNLV